MGRNLGQWHGNEGYVGAVGGVMPFALQSVRQCDLKSTFCVGRRDCDETGRTSTMQATGGGCQLPISTIDRIVQQRSPAIGTLGRTHELVAHQPVGPTRYVIGTDGTVHL